MRPIHILPVLLFLCLVQGVFAFNITDYLYSGETMQMVSASDLSLLNGTTVTLYTIKSVPSMLVTSSGVILSDQASIMEALKSHYTKDVLPSDSEVSSIKSEFSAFNSSRNYLFKQFGGGAEDICLKYSYLQSFPCHDLATCEETATMVCQLAAAEQLSCDTSIMSSAYLDYTTQLAVFNSRMPEMFLLIDSVTADNAATSIDKMRADIAAVKNAVGALQNNNLRGLDGLGGVTCANCIGMCSFSHFDTNSLSSADTSLAAISARLGPVKEMPTTARTIAANTKERVNYKASLALLAAWQPKWNQLKAKYSSLEKNATALSKAISDSNFTSVYNQFETAYNSMDTRMTSLNFDGVESDMNAVSSLAPKLNSAMASASVQYLQALSSKNKANDAVIIARWAVKADSAASVSAYNALAQKKNSLDAKFQPPMSSAAYASISNDYDALANQSQAYVASQRQIADAVSGAGEAFGQMAINSVFSLSDALYSVPATTRTQVAPVIPPIILFIIDLAFVSIALVVFVGAILKFRQLFTKKAVLGVWIALLFGFLFVLAIGSVGMFFLIDQSSHSGTLDDFMSLVGKSNTAYVGIDQNGAAPDALTSMAGCAQNISGQLKARYGKGAQIFYYSGARCTINNTALSMDDCLNRAGDVPVMYLHYNQTSLDPKFFVVYQKQADLYGDAAYYNRCEIGDVLN